MIWMESLVLVLGLCQGAMQEEARRDLEQRIEWWNEARFGMFIHWGLYAIPAGRWNGEEIGGIGEWIQNSARIRVADYEPLKKQFNPVKFNAEQWAAIAKDAGMKYLVITSKHHDGFCLFDSQHTDWDIAGTPFRRDILKELSNAVRAAGLRMCFYHSIMDWHHPDYLPRRDFDPRPDRIADFPRYVKHLKSQLRELVVGYGPLGVLWFDGEWEATWNHELGMDLYDHVRSLQPDILINNRVDKGREGMAGLTAKGDFRGDFGTPEQEVPATGMPGVCWESCMTMNDTWGYKASDHNWKSATQLVQTLCDTASKGGNFLLNVGPTAEGLIPEPSVERLSEMGEWLRINGECIYGTSAGPFPSLKWGRCTQKPGRLYLMVFDWPRNGELKIPGLMNPLTRAWLLRQPDLPLVIERTGSSVVVSVSDTLEQRLDNLQPPFRHVTVVVLEIEGEPVVVEVPILPDPDGSVHLHANEANVSGQTARYESREDRLCIGFWTEASDWVSWKFQTRSAGTYRLEVVQACAPDEGGGRLSIEVGGQSRALNVKPTASWGDFVTVALGEVTVPAGEHELIARPETISGHALMNLRAISLVPVR